MVPGQLVEGFVSKVSSNGLTIELTELLPSSSLPAVRREIADLRIKVDSISWGWVLCCYKFNNRVL